MTREEKIALLVDELEDIRCDNFDADTDEDRTLKEAVRVIKALEQEPCEDYISREEVIKTLYGLHIGGKEAVENESVFDHYSEALHDAVYAIEELPSVKSIEPCEDCISR